jgi:uncharacterized protein YjbI with pentapeptide repeats/beta-lactamase regulating signal transducer with metallopeptidase domain
MLAALVDTFTAVATPIAAVVLNALWQGPLLVGAVWLMVRTWPQLNASTRYAIWCTTLAAVVIVPIATTLPFFTFAAAVPPTTTSSSPQTTAQAQRVVRAPKVTHALTTVNRPQNAAKPLGSPVNALPARLSVTFPFPLAVGVFALWIVLALVALARLTIGLLRLEQLKRDALPLPVEYRDAMDRWARANKGSREVRLCVSDETDVPVAVGLFDAMILIPRSLLEQLSATEVDQISLHELAHLRRGDDWTNGFQRIALALLAWNPAALFVSQQIDLEREVACDDWVLSLTGTVRPYALCLTKMAETSTWPRQPMPAPGVFATRKHISLRIERLLFAGRNVATTLALGPAAIAVVVVATLSLAIAAVAPSVAAPCLQALAPQPPVAALPAAPKVERIIVYRSAPAPSTPAMPAIPSMPATKVHAAPQKVHVAQQSVHVPAIDVHVPATDVHVPATDVDLPGTDVRVPAINVNVPHVDVHSIVQNALKGIPMHHMVAQTAVPDCSGCDYSGANWAGKDVRNRNYTGVDLSNANLQGTDFSSSHLSGVDFTHANLQGAKFRSAQLTGCDFSGANLIGTDFTGAKLSGCQFTGAAMTSSEIRSVLNTCTGCDFTKADLSGVDLSNLKSNGNDFTGANLSGSNMSGSEFTGDDFTHANFNGARLDGTTFSGCDLSGVDLTRVDLSRTKMLGTDFSVRRSPEP